MLKSSTFFSINPFVHCHSSTAEELDEEDAHSSDEDDDEGDVLGDGPLNIGKAFLIPRAKMSLYDQDIFAHSMLEARDKVRLAADH